MDRQTERVFRGKTGPVLCTTASLKSLFEHVTKRSLRFYHMARVWTPPCSALLYSVCTDAFQSDCSASFSLCMSVVSLSHYWLFRLLPPPHCFLFTINTFLFFSPLVFFSRSLSHLPLSTYSLFFVAPAL